jgi:tetratricopeptide (TPR) repeat protein
MKRLAITLCILPGLCAGLFGQQPSIRNPQIDTETPEGQLIAQAGTAEDPAEKIKYLETFVEKYAGNPNIGFVYLQLQGLYAADGGWDKVAEFGTKLLAIVPNDLEVRHNTIKAYEGKQDFEKLHALLAETEPIAQKQKAAPKPADEDEDVQTIWKNSVDYASGVVDYVEYSLYTSILKISDPAVKIKFLDTLRGQYPEGKYKAQLPDFYVAAYQQQGDIEKMAGAMKDAVAVNPGNEAYLFTLIQYHLGKDEREQAKGYAEQLLQAVENKEKPASTSDEDWAKHKTLFTARANYMLGRVMVLDAKNNNDFREARKLMLSAVDPMKEAGGQDWGIMAYMLGICYVKLDIRGDNIKSASAWMSTAASVENPYQAAARDTLSKIKAN